MSLNFPVRTLRSRLKRRDKVKTLTAYRFLTDQGVATVLATSAHHFPLGNLGLQERQRERLPWPKTSPLILSVSKEETVCQDETFDSELRDLES